MSKISKEEVSAAAVGPAFAYEFDSKLPTEQELRNAALDPLNDALTENRKDPALARDLQRDAVALAQAVQVIAVNRGFGGFDSLGPGVLSPLVKLVGQAAFDKDANIAELVVGASASIVDGVLAAVGSVPFVGAAANIIWAAVNIVYHTAGPGRDHSYPPLYQMSPAKDSDQTIRALEMLKESNDWTRLFLPRTMAVLEWDGTGDDGPALPGGDPEKHPTLGGWGEDFRENGIEFQRPLRSDGIAAFGCSPGSLTYVDDGAQARITAGDVTLPGKRKPRYIDVLRAGGNMQAAHDLVFPRGQWLPSLSALARGTWAAAASPTSTAMFNFDAEQLATEWQLFEDSCVAWREFLRDTYGRHYDARLPKLGERERRRHIAVFLSRVAAAQNDKLRIRNRYDLRTQILNRTPTQGLTVGKQAVAQAKNLAKRQHAAVGTGLNALVSKNAAAFKANPQLRTKLLASRQAMLKAGVFDSVNLLEVPDLDLRARIADRLPGDGSLADPHTIEQQRRRAEKKRELERYVIRKAMPKALPFDEPASGAGGGGALLLAAGAAALALF